MNQDFWAKPTIASLCCGSPGSLSEIQTYDILPMEGKKKVAPMESQDNGRIVWIFSMRQETVNSSYFLSRDLDSFN